MMKTLLKRFIPCLLIVLSIFAIVSCKDGNKYEYPNPSPLYTNEGTFVQVGDLKVTNKDVYNRLIQSYGIEEIKNVIDAQLLKDVVLTEEQERDFQDQLLESKYGTTDVDSLTEEEKIEQQQLRRQFIDDFKRNLRGNLDNISIKEADGSITHLGEKHGIKEGH